MPAVAGNNPVKTKLKQMQKLFDAHKSDETSLGSGGDLPAGINGGVAQLCDMRIQEHKEGDHKGKLHLYVCGIVKTPSEYEGCRASIIVRLYEHFGKSQEDGIAKAMNETRKMGGTTADISVDDWEAILAALEETAPHFRFRTYEFTPEGGKPMVITEFRGAIKDYKENGSAAEVQDNTGNGAGDTQQAPEGEDWAALGEAADAGDADAATKLKDACLTAGMSEGDVDAMANWVAAAEALASAGGAGGGDTSGAAEPWEPKVEDFYTYKPKGAKKSEEFQVTHVFKETMNLKGVKDNKVLKGVKWTSEPPAIDGQPI